MTREESAQALNFFLWFAPEGTIVPAVWLLELFEAAGQPFGGLVTVIEAHEHLWRAGDLHGTSIYHKGPKRETPA